MKVVILDRNPAVLEYFSFLLKDFKVNLKTFTQENECLQYLSINNDIDFIFVEDFFYEKFIDIFEDVFFIILSFKVKELNIENNFFYIFTKDITPLEFKIKFGIIVKLRMYVLKEKEEKNQLTDVISYKNLQEEMATKKQLKLLIDELSMFYENNFLIETYYKSKDILSGDALITKRIDENKYFLAIIDAMGKGLSASLTASNCVGFLNYSLTQALKNNDFEFNKLVEDFINYVKSILIEDESLCFMIGYIEKNKFKFANFGMPPIYVDRNKIKPNNLPLSEWNKKINIDEVEFENDILMYSDGLIESQTKQGSVYFKNFKKLLLEFEFLNDIIKDFKKNAIQSDDITIIYVKKENMKFEKIYEKEIIVNSTQNIDEFLKNFNLKISQKEKIEFILHELLMNSYEHSLLKLNKNDKMENENNKKFVKVRIVIYINDRLIKIHYSDSGEGFDIGMLKTLAKDKFHGRGIKMIKFISKGIFYNPKGNSVIVFLNKN